MGSKSRSKRVNLDATGETMKAIPGYEIGVEGDPAAGTATL
jgi:hypothetical protein